MSWLTTNADLIGGILGVFGSLVLGYPFVTEMTDRRQWELLRKFKNEVLGQNPASPIELEAHRQIRDSLIDARLGQYTDYLWITIVGFALLLVAFMFIAISAFTRTG